MRMRDQPVTALLGVCIVLSLAFFGIGVAAADWVHYPGQAGSCLFALWLVGPPQTLKKHQDIERLKADQSLARANAIIQANREATDSETTLFDLEDGLVSVPKQAITRRY